jgi:hypothetical protein
VEATERCAQEMQRYRRGVGVWECGKEMVGVQAVKGGGGRRRKCCWLAVDGRRAMGDDGCEMRAAAGRRRESGTTRPLIAAAMEKARLPKAAATGAGMRQGRRRDTAGIAGL